MANDYMELRNKVNACAKEAAKAGWVSGSSGNISLRVPGAEDLYVITPSGVSYDRLSPEQVVVCDESSNKIIDVETLPSFEFPLHLAVYKARPDVMAVIHTHAVFSTVLSVLRTGIPPIVEEMVPYLGGAVEVADYAQSGTDRLAKNVVKALSHKAAVLIANHGNVGVGRNLEKAFTVIEQLERVARIYLECLKTTPHAPGGAHTIPPEVIENEKAMYEKLKES
ncbi:MAG: class II aldolase/adducin family protein [bacterium]